MRKRVSALVVAGLISSQTLTPAITTFANEVETKDINGEVKYNKSVEDSISKKFEIDKKSNKNYLAEGKLISNAENVPLREYFGSYNEGFNALSGDYYNALTRYQTQSGYNQYVRWLSQSKVQLGNNSISDTIQTVAIRNTEPLDFSKEIEIKGKMNIDESSFGFAIAFHNEPNYKGNPCEALGVYATDDPKMQYNQYGLDQAMVFEVDTKNDEPRLDMGTTGPHLGVWTTSKTGGGWGNNYGMYDIRNLLNRDTDFSLKWTPHDERGGVFDFKFGDYEVSSGVVWSDTIADMIRRGGYITLSNNAYQEGRYSPISTIDATITVSVPDRVINIPDTNFRNAICRALNKPNGSEISYHDLIKFCRDNKNEDYFNIDLRNKGIKNIEGIQFLIDAAIDTGLNGRFFLRLDNNQISDLSPIAKSKNAEKLQNLNFYLDNNKIEDISPLCEFAPKIANLSLKNNQISDLSAFAGKKFSSLYTLYLDNNQISDATPFATMSLSNNKAYIHLGGNQISDLSPFYKMINRTYMGVELNLGTQRINAGQVKANGDEVTVKNNVINFYGEKVPVSDVDDGTKDNSSNTVTFKNIISGPTNRKYTCDIPVQKISVPSNAYIDIKEQAKIEVNYDIEKLVSMRPDGSVVLPGADKTPGNEDDVTVKPGNGQKPTVGENGDVTLPGGGTVVKPGGEEVQVPGGTIVKPDGTIILPGGSELKPDGSIVLPGEDGTLGNDDDVTVKPGDGEKPTVGENGDVTLPGGGTVVKPDGEEVQVPAGTVVKPDGTIILPGGSELKPDGSIVLPGEDGTLGNDDDVTVKPGNGQKPTVGENGDVTLPGGGTVVKPGGEEVQVPGGTIVKPDGTIILPGGSELKPDGSIVLPGEDGTLGNEDDVTVKPGNGQKPTVGENGDVTLPGGGTVVKPGGEEVQVPAGTVVKPDGTITLPDGTIIKPGEAAIESNFKEAYWDGNHLVFGGTFDITGTDADQNVQKVLKIKNEQGEVVKTISTWNASWNENTGYQCFINAEDFESLSNGKYKL
uniref:leucine-rich repeat domain-containing protein n=1 Tax=Clostridium perfringens TaxID=1502 RepID=UPI0039EA1731